MRPYRRLSSAVLVCLFLTVPALAQAPVQQRSAAPQEPVADFVFPAKYPFRFIAYGDIRFTDPKSENWSNVEHRRALVAEIAKQKPKALIFAGDLVRKGSIAADWDVMERETAPWRDASIPFLPVIGNHETWGDPQAVNYFRHFPELKDRHWYTAKIGNCFFIMLESEPNRPGTEQWTWMEQQLRSVPADAAYLFVVLHHPPYTRSEDKTPGGGHSIRPEEKQLAELLAERRQTLGKPIIVLAGHVHNYERYVHDGVTYIVTGGGGATPYEIPRQHDDAYDQPGATYSFCRFTIARNSLKFEMLKLDLSGGKPTFKVKDIFEFGAKAKAAVSKASE